MSRLAAEACLSQSGRELCVELRRHVVPWGGNMFLTGSSELDPFGRKTDAE